MAIEPSEGRPVPDTLPPSLDEWLSDRAEATGVEREQSFVDLLGAYRGATGAEASEGWRLRRLRESGAASRGGVPPLWDRVRRSRGGGGRGNVADAVGGRADGRDRREQRGYR